MSINERKAREKEELRNKILSAVYDLISRGGFEKLSMRKIAEVIEYSPSTIYRFFKNKNELLGSITDKTYADLSSKFNKLKLDETSDKLEMLKMVIREYIQFCLARPNIYKLYIFLCKLDVRDGGMIEVIGDNSYRIFSSWQILLDKLIKEGKLKYTSPISLLLLIWHTTDGFIANRINHPNLPWQSDQEEIDRLLYMIFNGIMK